MKEIEKVYPTLYQSCSVKKNDTARPSLRRKRTVVVSVPRGPSFEERMQQYAQKLKAEVEAFPDVDRRDVSNTQCLPHYQDSIMSFLKLSEV